MKDLATELLIRGRARLSAPFAWTQGAFAREHWNSDSTLHPRHPGATCWCSLGVCRAVEDSKEQPKPWSLTSALSQAEGRLNAWSQANFDRNVDTYNDDLDRTQAEILAMFDAVIEAGPLPHQTALEELQK